MELPTPQAILPAAAFLQTAAAEDYRVPSCLKELEWVILVLQARSGNSNNNNNNNNNTDQGAEESREQGESPQLRVTISTRQTSIKMGVPS